MAIHKLPLLLCLSTILLFLSNPVLSDTDEEDILMRDLNTYRTSMNLSTLVENKNAECLADEIADQFKNQPCTNATGANTVPGTEPQFANFPQLLAKCRLTAAETRDGSIMPACVPRLEAGLVLSNFTKAQYSKSLNDSKFTGIGIGTEDDWIVVVLTTNTPEGSYNTPTTGGTLTPGTPGATQNSVSSGFTLTSGLVNYLVIFMFSLCLFLY